MFQFFPTPGNVFTRCLVATGLLPLVQLSLPPTSGVLFVCVYICIYLSPLFLPPSAFVNVLSFIKLDDPRFPP